MGDPSYLELVNRWAQEFDRCRLRLREAWAAAIATDATEADVVALRVAAAAWRSSCQQAETAIVDWCQERTAAMGRRRQEALTGGNH